VIDVELLKEMVEKGFVNAKRHPELPLTIYDYSRSCQYDRVWNEVTLLCRGLILDDDYNIIARPLKKFFNWEEIRDLDYIDLSQDYEIYDKADGSLGIFFWYSGNHLLTTRGSFFSDQAMKGFFILENYDYHQLDENYTWLFEIVYPENRIVLDYGNKEKLILISAVEKSTGNELSREELELISYNTRFPIVDCRTDLEGYTFKYLKELDIKGLEGFVIKFKDGNRMKIKFENYCILHNILTGITSYDIWRDMVAHGKVTVELLDEVPDEFYEWVHKIEKGINDVVQKIIEAAHSEYEKIKHIESQKDFAEAAIKTGMGSLLFRIRKGQELYSVILPKCKPEYEKPFSNDEDKK